MPVSLSSNDEGVPNAVPPRHVRVLMELRRHAARPDAPRWRRVLTRPVRQVLPRLLITLDRSRSTLVTVTAPTFFGDDMCVQLPEAISRDIYRYGFYDRATSSFLIHILRQGSTFVDVGSHVGYFSLLAAHLVGAEGRVVAIEPNPLTGGILRQNVGSVEHVHVDARAVGATAGEVELQIPPPALAGYATGASASRIEGREARAGEGRWFTEVVPLVTLDEVMGDDPVDLVKIDVENFESAVLDGATRILRQQRPAIVLELGDEGNRQPPSRALVRRLMAEGYRPYEELDLGIVAHAPREVYEFSNVLFVHRDRGDLFEGA